MTTQNIPTDQTKSSLVSGEGPLRVTLMGYRPARGSLVKKSWFLYVLSFS